MTDLVTWLRQQLGAEDREARFMHEPMCVEMQNRGSTSECSCDRPARIRAEVAAKRAILDLHTKAGAGAGAFDLPDVCRPVSRGIGAVAPWPC